jgi:hypothetical protein
MTIKINLPKKLLVRTHLSTFNAEVSEFGERWNAYLITLNNDLVVLFSQKLLTLGEGSYIIEEGSLPYHYTTKEQVYMDLEKDKIFEKLWKDNYEDLQKNYKKANETQKYEMTISLDAVIGENLIDKFKVVAANTLWSNLKKYVISTAIDLETAASLTPEMRIKYLNVYITAGWEIDSILLMLVRTGLVRFEAVENYNQYAKYRGHALVIKNTKSGMTSTATRVGLNISTASFSSIEGFAENKYGTRHSILHEQTGLINFDEFLLMKDNMVLKMYNFLEQGFYLTGKNAQLIENKSCAQCIFTANPTDFEAGNPESINNDGTNISPETLTSTFRSAIQRLTSTSRAMGSRFGLVVFHPEMKAAIKKEIITQSEVDEAKYIIDSLILFSLADIKNIYDNQQVQRWLDTPLPEYKKEIEKLAWSGQFDSTVRSFWLGQTEAYRHIRGLALAESILDNLIINNNKNIDDIVTDASDSLKDVCKINIDSLKRLKEYGENAPISAEEINNLHPAYIKPILHTMVLLKNSHPERESFTLNEILENYNILVPEWERKEKYGIYAWSARIRQKMIIEKIKRILENYMKIAVEEEFTIFFTNEDKNSQPVIDFFSNGKK